MPYALYWIRHGATVSTEAQRVCGASDAALSPRGEIEMDAVARFLAEKELRAVYSSPLSRAYQPAQRLAAARGLTHHVLDELAEIDFGAWEGRSFAEIALRWPLQALEAQRVRAEFTFPGGENVAAFQTRALRAFELICAGLKGPAAVYTHGGILRMLVGELNGLSLLEAKALSFSTGSVTVLEWNGARHCVVAQNLYAHLPTLK